MNHASQKTRSMNANVAGATCLGHFITVCTSAPGIVSPGVQPELKHSWEVSFNRGDAAAVATLYAPDAQLLMSGIVPTQGTKNTQHAIERMINERLKATVDAEQNVASGDLAYVFGTYRVQHGDGGAEAEHGGYVEVWMRQNGVWRITLDVNATGAAAILSSTRAAH